MKFSLPWRIVCVLASLSLAVFVGMALGRKEAPRPAASQASEEARTQASKVSPAFCQEIRQASPPTESTASPLGDLESIEAAQSPEVLARYLRSRDPEVRVAAVDALIRIGDPAAVPLLEAAAHQLPPEDAAPLLDAARFLALPDATGFLSKKAEALPRPKESGGRKPRMMGRKTAEQATPAEEDSPPR